MATIMPLVLDAKGEPTLQLTVLPGSSYVPRGEWRGCNYTAKLQAWVLGVLVDLDTWDATFVATDEHLRPFGEACCSQGKPGPSALNILEQVKHHGCSSWEDRLSRLLGLRDGGVAWNAVPGCVMNKATPY